MVQLSGPISLQVISFLCVEPMHFELPSHTARDRVQRIRRVGDAAGRYLSRV